MMYVKQRNEKWLFLGENQRNKKIQKYIKNHQQIDICRHRLCFKEPLIIGLDWT